MRNKHYKAKAFRLSDEVIKELEKRNLQYKSWNLLFEELLKIKKNKIKI